MPSKYDHYKELIISRGIPDATLAEVIGCTRSSIRTIRWKFLNPRKNNEYRKSWRKKNPKKDLAQAKRYQRSSKKNNWNSGTAWLPHEDELVLSRKKSDKKLSKFLGRPLSAIWTHRYKLKQDLKKNESKQ